MVRFFGKQTKGTTSRSKSATTASPASTPEPVAPPPGPPAKAAAATDGGAAEKKTPTRVRRAPSRPPRRDWAAEAAAAPVDGPAPIPTSLATSPGDDGDPSGAPAKRRRGTRGGRGRKKPGATNGESAPSLALVPARRDSRSVTRESDEPPSLEAVVAEQSRVLEQFAYDMNATLVSLQSTIAGLQQQLSSERQTAGGQRVGIFVDVPNVIYAAERRNVNIDFGRVLDYFTRGRQLVRASAYAPISDDPQAKLESQRFVHHFVGHPYRIITKPLKRFADGSMKANFDIELAIDILTMSDRLDVVVLMSGDGDFRRLVEMVSSRGVRVEVVAFGETASSELKSVADLYVELGAHLDDFKAQ